MWHRCWKEAGKGKNTVTSRHHNNWSHLTLGWYMLQRSKLWVKEVDNSFFYSRICLKHKIHSKKIVHRIVQIVTSLSACLSKLKEIDEDARIITGKAWLYRLNISGLNTKTEYTIWLFINCGITLMCEANRGEGGGCCYVGLYGLGGCCYVGLWPTFLII